MSSPIYEPIIRGKELPSLVPLYPLTEGLSQKIVKSVIENALNTLIAENYEFPEIFSAETLEKMDLLGVKDALLEIHFPSDKEKIKTARERFVFEELYAFALGISLAKKHKSDGNALVMSDVDISEFMELVPYGCTNLRITYFPKADLSEK